MANIASSKKDARQSAVRAVRNRSIRSAVKTKVTKFRRAAAEGEASEGQDLLSLGLIAVAALDRAAAKGVLHPNNAARRKGRLTRRLNAATGEAPAAPTPAAPAKKKPTGKAVNAKAKTGTTSARGTAKPAAKSAGTSGSKASAKK